MAEQKINWTEQQKQAIGARGSDVLVTASAGTGKTAVLSGRCVDIVSDKSLCPEVSELLVLTFTEAAAEQMQSRIADRLRSAFLKTRDPHLRRQLVLLQVADISTMHSFCKRLITEHFYNLALDPTFDIIDGDEQKLLKAEVLEKTIDWAWQQGNLTKGLRRLLLRRDLRTNDGFLAKIIDLSDFLDGVVFRQDWYERASLLAAAADPFTTDLGEKQKQIVAEKLQYILNQLRLCQKLYDSQGGGDWAQKLDISHIRPVAECIEFLQAGDWDKCAEVIINFDKPKTYKPKDADDEIADFVRQTARKAVTDFKGLSQLATVNPEYLDRVGPAAGLQTGVLVELVRKFDLLYAQAKKSLNSLDFADLERNALELLTEPAASSDTLSPSQTALALRRRYKYIFVDEYQDINPVQQAIIDALGSGDNVFVVGDVKQSIYAWRGAEPDIFLERLARTRKAPADAPDFLRVDLTTNFRSAKGILDFVNSVFSRIMTAPFAKINYDESAQLKPAAETSNDSRAAGDEVEFHVLDETAVDIDSAEEEKIGTENTQYEDNLVSHRQRQAALIARRIRQMVGADTGAAEFQIYDKEKQCLRDVDYRDIVILMRSLAKKANDYVEVLQLASVPVSCQATAGYFEATEISDLLCLLKVLDNPQRDIELAAVLRSPFFKVSDTDLAKIRLHSRTNDNNFYDCLLQYRETGPDAELAERLRKILTEIERWRTLARRGDLADLIWMIYRETNFLSFVSALPNGRARRANLLKLHDRAIQFEGFAGSAHLPSLTRFVRFIEKLQEVGQDWAPSEPQDSAGNAVRILSVHKSKGLEFPVVFLSELETRFNKKDVYADCLANASDTLGLQIIDHQSNSKLRSLAHEVIAEHKLSISLAEEMRILYVAATRARERLILTASQKRSTSRRIITNGLFFGDGPIPPWQLRSAQSPLEWLLYAFSNRQILHDAFETGLEGDAAGSDLFSLKLYEDSQLRELSQFIIAKRNNKLAPRPPAKTKRPAEQKDPQLLSKIKESLDWRYRFGDAYLLPAKDSVTRLTHHGDEYMKIDYSLALGRRPSVLLPAEPDLTKPPEPRLIGSATHLLLSRLDLTAPVTKDTIAETKEKLLSENAVSASVADHIDTESILAFFHSDLGRTVLDSKNTVLPEWPFTLALPAWHGHPDRVFWDEMSQPQGRATGGSFRRSSGMAPADTLGAPRDTQSCPERSRRDAIRLSAVASAKAEDTIIVQGIIDMLIRTPKGLLVIDFKTDQVTADRVPQRAEIYRRQLDLYARAASAILKADTLAKYLYFLTPSQAVKL